MQKLAISFCGQAGLLPTLFRRHLKAIPPLLHDAHFRSIADQIPDFLHRRHPEIWVIPQLVEQPSRARLDHSNADKIRALDPNRKRPVRRSLEPLKFRCLALHETKIAVRTTEFATAEFLRSQ